MRSLAPALLAVLGLLVALPAPGAPPDKDTPPDALLLSPPAPARVSSADSVVAAMVAQVNGDSLHAFLEKLTGEVPVTLDWGTVSILSRYAPSPGAEHAAEFLAGVFAGYGYDAELHYFNFPYNLEAVWIDGSGLGLCVGGSTRVIRTEDFEAWTRARTGLETSDTILRGIDHVSGDRFVTVGNSGFVATSVDAGASWTPRTSVTGSRLNAVAVEPSGAGWAVGRNGAVLRTTDAGDTWTLQTSGTTEHLNGVQSLGDPEAVAVATGGVVLRTTDGGAVWSSVTSSTTADLLGLDFVGDLGWAVGGMGTVIHSTDRGATWTPQSSGTPLVLNGVSFADASNGWAVGGLSVILHTTDGGTTWTAQTSPVANTNLKSVFAVSASEAWITGLSGILLRTTDGGAVWESRKPTVHDGWANVVATLPGRSTPEEEVLLVGHYDSISDLPDPGVLAPGADDNGTGIAVIAESARLLASARYERTIRFVCFSMEEQSLGGSEAYAARAEALGTPIVAVFNLDSVGWNDTYFRIFSNDDSGWLGTVAADMAALHAPGLPTYHWYCPNCNWSDHWSFQEHGFPAIVGIETWDPAPPQHHTVGDTLGLVDIPLVMNVTRIALSTIATVAGVDTTVVVSAPLASGDATALRLLPARPNPSPGEVGLAYEIARPARVRLTVHDVAGRLVRRLVDAPQERGSHRATWAGTDAGGRVVAPGVYFFRLEVEDRTVTERVTIVR